jgi:arylsulfatase A-like enzyme
MSTGLLLLAVLSAALADGAPERPPNIVLIYADDLGWADVGFNGRTAWATPNLDRLAAEGTVFRRWYTAAVVCAPSRAALLTGRHGIHNGVVSNREDLPAREVTLAEALQPRGYATALMGKWHRGSGGGEGEYVHPVDQGFDEFFGFTDGKHAQQKFPEQLWQGRELRKASGYADTLFTDHALEFVTAHRDRPFFLYLAYTAPHFVMEAPAEDVARYRGKFEEKDPARPVNAIYAAMVARMDAEIGRLLKTLDRLRLAQRTLLIFTSDHGATFEGGNEGASAYHDSNRPFRGEKRTLWEGGLRVPAVVRWPGWVPRATVSSEVVHMTDVFPTLLAAAGGVPEPAWRLDGRDVLPVWMAQARSPDRTLFWEWRAEGLHQVAAMRGNLKWIRTGDFAPEMYDVEYDPAERRSIITEHGTLAKQLEEQVRSWLATETRGRRSSARP